MIESKHRLAFVSQHAAGPADAEHEWLQPASSHAVRANFTELGLTCRERRRWQTRWRCRMRWHAP
jgi:hypothetical protein